mmetsp:Transcript_88317/g.248720  ORF Transcript_88317/g.248720 Transcript_88317/m.248720 type:complete len:223 (+) Transcript_88317:573-1241(+)
MAERNKTWASSSGASPQRRSSASRPATSPAKALARITFDDNANFNAFRRCGRSPLEWATAFGKLGFAKASDTSGKSSGLQLLAMLGAAALVPGSHATSTGRLAIFAIGVVVAPRLRRRRCTACGLQKSARARPTVESTLSKPLGVSSAKTMSTAAPCLHKPRRRLKSTQVQVATMAPSTGGRTLTSYSSLPRSLWTAASMLQSLRRIRIRAAFCFTNERAFS